MKSCLKLLLLSLALLIPSIGKAATETWLVTDLVGTPQPFLPTALASPSAPNNNLVGGFTLTNLVYKFSTDGTGLVTYTNLVPGTYVAVAQLQNGYTAVRFTISNNVGTYSITNNATVASVSQGLSNAYPIIVSDARYPSVAGSNITFVFTNGQLVINASGGASAPITNIVAGSGLTASTNGATSTVTVTTNGALLAGDVTGPTGGNTVTQVGGQTAANVAAGAVLANAATTNNTANTIVARAADGSFSAANIRLSGQITNNATNFLNGVLQTVPNNLVISNVCGVTASLHSYAWTVASGTMPFDNDENIGVVFILNSGDQYTIAWQQDATHFYTTTSANSNFVNASPIFDLPPHLFRDISSGLGFIRGAIDAGGCYHGTAYSTISGIFLHDAINNKNNGWTITTTSLDGIPAFAIQSWTNGYEAFQISSHAQYNDLCVLSNDDVALRGALINEQFGDLLLGGGINSQTTNIQVRGYMNAGGANFSNVLTVVGNISKNGTVWNSVVSGETNLIAGGQLDPNSALTVSNVLVSEPNYSGSGPVAFAVSAGTGVANAGNGLALVQSTTTIATINNNGSANGTPQIRLEGNNAHSEIDPNFPGQWDLGDASKYFGTYFGLAANVGTITVTNAPTVSLTNAQPAGVTMPAGVLTIGTNKIVWLTITNGGLTYSVMAVKN
jgi:hypothetical protein